MEYKIDYYKKLDKKIPFNDWLEDQDMNVRAMINIRLDRLSFGNFSNCDPVRENVSEVKIHKGPGYRIYYNMIGLKVVLVLNAGIKKTQSRDINKAIEYLADYKARGKNMARSKNRQSLLIESLKNPKEAEAYFNAVLEACKECDEEEAQKLILLAFKNLTEAQGGVSKLALKTGLGRESLYKTLSAQGNPRLSTIISVTYALLQRK